MSIPRTVSVLALFSAALLIAPSVPLRAQAPAVAAYSIIDNTSGYVLESANAQKKLQIGSLTKVATAMVVLDWSEAKAQDLGQMVTVPQSAEAIPAVANAIDFRAGDQCSLRDLLYAALLQSDNRAAQTLAAHVGQTLGQGEPVATFVVQMNALARRIGMERTKFVNAHGLDDNERPVPYSTAEDLAKLTRYAMERAAFRFYVSQRERKITVSSSGGQNSSYLLRNTNELLGEESIDGVKTGTTRRAGQCLIISAARPPESRQEGETHLITPRRVDLVVLGAADRFGTARALLAKGWRLYDSWAAAGRPMPQAKGKGKR